MAKFSIQWKIEKKKGTVRVSGGIDEDAVFTNEDLSAVQNLDIDFKDVDSINSCGVREWVKWLKVIPTEIQIRYLNCPTFMIDQMNMVAGLTRKGIKVQSFYTPYYCDKCGVQTKVLLEEGKDFVGSKLKEHSAVKCSTCGGPTEIDVIESNYFKFMHWQE